MKKLVNLIFRGTVVNICTMTLSEVHCKIIRYAIGFGENKHKTLEPFIAFEIISVL